MRIIPFSFCFVLNFKFSKLTNKNSILIFGRLNKLFAERKIVLFLRLDMKILTVFKICIFPLHYRLQDLAILVKKS